MANLQRILCCSLAIASTIGVRSHTVAQAPPSPAATAAPAATPAASPERETNPAILAALELQRETPADFLQAISWLIDLGRPELAKPILDELTKLQLTDAQRAALVEQFGSHTMLQLARSKELAPAGGQFAEASMNAAAAATQNPERIAKLVAQLADPSIDVRHAAQVDLAAAGNVGIAATLEALARETDPSRRAALLAAAARMEPLVVGPLLAMLDTHDAALQADVSRLLQLLNVTQAAPFLAASSASAERALSNAIDRYSAGTPPFAVDEQNEVTLWHWDDATKKLSAAKFLADDARTIWLARLARALARWQPGDRNVQRQALVLGVEADALAVPNAANALATTETSMLNEALADAMVANYPHAAIAIIDTLGKRGDHSVLHAAAPKLSPLVAALESPSRRVRFAALRTIMALDPTTPYPGSSHVPEALAYFAGSTGGRRAVVAMPTMARATDLAGQLAASQIEGEGTNNGRDVVDIARRTADLELVLVDMNILANEVRQVIYELRTHPETGQIPIAILAADGRLDAAQRIAEEHNRVFAVSRPHTPEALAHIVAELQALAGRDAVPADERAAQAVDATAWIAKVLAERRPLYVVRGASSILETAAYQPDSSNAAITALAELGRPEGQLALINFASQGNLPAQSRAAAIAAFRKNIDENGVLLTTDQIIEQYQRYNASAQADADTLRVLGAILDAIESHRAADPPPPPWKMPAP